MLPGADIITRVAICNPIECPCYRWLWGFALAYFLPVETARLPDCHFPKFEIIPLPPICGAVDEAANLRVGLPAFGERALCIHSHILIVKLSDKSLYGLPTMRNSSLPMKYFFSFVYASGTDGDGDGNTDT